jgi:hypothetical protein
VELKVPFCSGSDMVWKVDYLEKESDYQDLENIRKSLLKERELKNSNNKNLLKEYGYKELDMPWDVDGKRAIWQEREYCASFLPTGCKTQVRLISNKGFKKHYIKKINKYLEDIPEYNTGSSQVAEKGYKIISINPIVVIITPKEEKTNIIDTKYRKCYENSIPGLFSYYLNSYVGVGSKFDFDDSILWFSPDLNIKPKRLSLKAKDSIKVEWKNGYIVFTEQNGKVLTKRFDK